MDVTHYLSLKPIPRWSPIPPNSVAYLQGFYYSDDLARGTMFVLYKNKQELVIVGPPLRKDKEVENMKEDDRRILLTNLFSEYLTIIEDLIPTIEFGITGHAHLVPDPFTDGYQIILDYEKQLRRVSCPTWAPIIPIEEVEVTVWGPFADRRGLWKGKEVDIMYAHDDLNMWRLNRAMYGFRRIDGLDFTFEVYGHLVNKDGQIVGLLTEAAWGRPLRLSDKEFVIAELKRLESFGYLYGACLLNYFLIADGNLRLLQPMCIRHYSDPATLNREAAFLHTRHLDELFQEFEDFGPVGNFRVLPPVLVNKNDIISYLRHPIPRGLSTSGMIFLDYIQRQGYRAIINYGDDDHTEDDHPISLVSLRTRRPQRGTLRLLYSHPSRKNGSLEDEDAPLSSNSKLRHRVFVPITHPYTQSTPTRIPFHTLHDGDSSESDADPKRRLLLSRNS